MGDLRVDELLRQGWQHYAVGDVVEAASCWRQILDVDPEHPEAKRLLGMMSVGDEAISTELASAEPEDLGSTIVEEPAIDVLLPDDEVPALEVAPGESDGFDLLNEPAEQKPIAVPDVKPKRSGPARPEADTLMDGARELFDLGDFSGSLALVQQALSVDPFHEEASSYLERNRGTLIQMYESKIGSLEEKPRVLLRPDEILWLNLDHRSGFVLAQLDGTISVEDIYALSGLSRLDTAKILAELLEQGVIST